ncbi:M56 family metallopeptidase [Polyangium sp. 6x1]|uniref:M56 family metallopeptidase n=1 Tax=Polyangium sp. 6x1 TaxID=3042689 RepID=UPI002482AD41|nr:M56 family metallopeptidase [Polyangium sp. 6x1]MDI1442788.1 M56 family metallopeptidase [Polyangium sp. 6x1]
MNTFVGWLVTYLIHSTVLLGGAWLVDRLSRNRPDWQELAWRVALVGGLVTATVQTAASLRPVGGTISLAEPAPTARVIEREMPRATEIVVATDMGPATHVVVTSTNATIVRPFAKATLPAKPARASFLSWSHVFVAGWALGALFLLGSLGRAWMALRKRLEGRRRLEGGPLGDVLATLAAREPICMRAPLLSASEKVNVPMALGIRHPEICLPERVTKELGPDAQESVLAHELGHVARRDPLYRLATSVFCRVFFFQPLNWLAAHRLAASAELLADDWAARRTARPLDLAECLTKVARWMHRPMTGLPVPTMAAGTSELRQRVERLVRGEGMTAEPRKPLWAAPIVAFVLTALTLLAPCACGVAEAKGLPPATAAAKKGPAPSPRPTPAALADEDDDEDADDDEEPVCEGPKHTRKAKDHAKAEKRRGEEHARRQNGRHGPVDQDDEDEDDNDNDNDNDNDDNDNDDDDDDAAEQDADDEENEVAVARGPRIHIHVPAPNVDIDFDQIERSFPSQEQFDAEVERALADVRKNVRDEDTRKCVEREIKRARKEARKELEEAREQMEEQLREVREQMPEIRRRAMETAREVLQQAREDANEEAREAEEEAMKAQKKARKARKKAKHAAPPEPPAPPALHGAPAPPAPPPPPGLHGVPAPPMPPMPPGPHAMPMPRSAPVPPAPPPPPAH